MPGTGHQKSVPYCQKSVDILPTYKDSDEPQMRIVNPTICHHKRHVLLYSVLGKYLSDQSMQRDEKHGQCSITALCNGSLMARTDMGCLRSLKKAVRLRFQDTHS